MSQGVMLDYACDAGDVVISPRQQHPSRRRASDWTNSARHRRLTLWRPNSKYCI